MRLLIIAPNWIGDAVMSLSLIQALAQDARRAFPDGRLPEIDVLAPAVTAPVYRFSKAVQSVQVEPFQHGQLQWSLRRQVGRGLRQARYDEVFVLPNSLKSALVAWFAKVPQRHGYAGELRTLILNRVLPKPVKTNKPPMVQWYGALGGFQEIDLANPQMKVAPALLQDTLQEFGLQSGYLALAPGAEFGPAKRWPAAHFAHVATDFLRVNPERQVVLHGGPKDLEFSREIVSLMPEPQKSRVLILASKTRLDQAIVLMAGAGSLVTNDSGLMHVGAALDVPLQAIFGSSSPGHTPPLNPSAVVHYLALECSPCFQRECPLGHTNCLQQLEPESVSRALIQP